MAKVYICEYTGFDGRNPEVPAMPGLAEQTVAIGGSSTQSAAFNAQTHLIRVHTDAICSISIGSDPTATANTARLAAGQTEYFAVAPAHKIAVITNT